MKTFALALLASLPICSVAGASDETDSYPEVSPQTPVLLCADQADNRIRLVDPFHSGDGRATLWCHPADDGTRFNHRPTDAKRVEIDGEVFILAAYHGRVQLVRFRDGKVVKDYPTLSSCHSAELLPDGSIVSVNSNHGILRWHRSADEFVDLELPYAHGVTWDKARECLWVLGAGLYRFRYAEGTLSRDRRFELPLTPTGHDLFPLRGEGSRLLVSNNDALFLFDIAKETFETVSELREIKSASQHADGSIWVSEPMRIEGAQNWHSDSIIPVRPREAGTRCTIDGARFYKARWWQQVDFSY